MVDQMVLKAQQWVNATYGTVAGYVRCREDGQTSWSVMYSLTRGLQHELGITTLSDSFGPTTSAKLDAHGPVGSAETNRNLLRIIQCACYCKGYAAGDIDGTWSGANAGVTDMVADMGLANSYAGKVTTKIFKALLTMDAYVLLSGGSSSVRAIQQWLNQRYLNQSWFSIIPTEGHYSRDVQKATMMALQSELGIADSSVTGNFGPATQAGLKNHELSQGATGIFVRLLSALCVFNGTVVNRDGDSTYTVFKATFDAPLGQYLTAYQTFMKLSVNGRADYGTWCQLLVSCGDPDRDKSLVGASDTRFTITTALAKDMVLDGYKVVGRYLDEPAGSTLNKEIQPGELDAIFAGGLRVFPIWQYNARELADFSFASGAADGARAHDRMVFYGFNRGKIIYFAVDYDATDEEITSNILPYFRGVQSALVARGRTYLAGVYGSRNVCTRATNEAQVAASFVSGMSWGFSGNLGFAMPYNWAFNQIKEFSYPGGGQTIDLDRDVHRPEIDPGIGRDGVGGATEIPLAGLYRYLTDVWNVAVAYGGDPNQRVMEYLRSPTYTKYYQGWDILLPYWDQEWIDYAEARVGRTQPFADPSTGELLHLDHLAATANATYVKGVGSGSAILRGDFGGWGGDLSTFYADWRNNTDRWKSGYAFCMENLGQRGNGFTFGYADFAEDADGYLIGLACKNNGANFHEQFKRHMNGTGQATRFKQLLNKRFAGKKTTVTAAAKTMMLDVGSDDALDTLRDLAIISKAGPFVLQPKELPAAELQLFLDGYADVLSKLATTG